MSARLSLPSSENVVAALADRRARLLASWRGPDGDLADGIVVLASGLVLPVEGSDQAYPFRAHDDHYYLSGARLPGQVLVCDPSEVDGGWALFAHRATAEERVWTGVGPDLDAQSELTGISCVRPVAELAAWLADRRGRPVALLGSMDLLERPMGYLLHPEQVAVLDLDADRTQRAQACVVRARRRKDAVELAFMRCAAGATGEGHRAGLGATVAGRTERRLQVEIDAAMMRAGAERTAYASIAVAGENCAVLHATAGDRLLAAGDLVLVDAGAEVEGYDSDVTRTWPVSPRFDGEQRALYELVLAVQADAIRGVRAGVEFRDLHMRTARAIAQGLVDFGLLRGNADQLVERDAHALFFPHGLGHLLGLATHDVGGYLAGRERTDRPGLKYLRADLPLEPGHVLTIEPGVYLVRALLQDDALRRRYADAVVWDRADAMLGFGGVRIEDDILVTDDEPEVLTAAIPKAVDDIEALRA